MLLNTDLTLVTVNHLVPGSSPGWAAIFKLKTFTKQQLLVNLLFLISAFVILL